jgi:long-chain fatty acid transport protein
LEVLSYRTVGVVVNEVEFHTPRRGTQYVDLESVSLNPNIAFKFSDQLSVAAGVEILRGGIKLKKTLTGLGDISADTSGYAVGGNLAVHYEFDDQWSAGLTWRAPMHMTTEGKGRRFATTSSSGQTIEATLPGSYTLGIGYQPMDNWSLEFDVIHTRWDSIDAMEYSGTISSTDRLYYKNAWRFQIGTEYWATDWFAMRFGYAYDQTPTRGSNASFMLPANDRQLFSTGLGFKKDRWNIDWSFMYVKAKERRNLAIDNPLGTDFRVDFKDGKTWITGLSVGYDF